MTTSDEFYSTEGLIEQGNMGAIGYENGQGGVPSNRYHYDDGIEENLGRVSRPRRSELSANQT